MPGVPAAVDLEIAEKQQHFFEMGHGQPVIDPEQRMGHGVMHLGLTQVGDKIVDIFPYPLHFGMHHETLYLA